MEALKIQDVAVSLSNKEEAQKLSIPSFSLEIGAQIAVVGRSGSGKSTFLNLISGLIPCKQGSILVEGLELVGLGEGARDKIRRDKIGMVFQTYQLLPEFSALENVQLGTLFSKVDSQERAHSLIDEVGLSGLADRRPSELSVGQQQRVSLARALIKQPTLILADEPTGALDQETGVQMCELIQNLARRNKATVLFVTHDMILAKRFDQQVDISDISSWGTTKERRVRA